MLDRKHRRTEVIRTDDDAEEVVNSCVCMQEALNHEDSPFQSTAM